MVLIVKKVFEILNSPVFRNFIISEDGKTSGIVVYIKDDKKINEISDEKILKEYKELKKIKNHENINEIRNVINDYRKDAKIYLGGIPMIADDMMSFIKKDIFVFGIGVFLFIVITLWYVFRKLVWVIIPLTSCLFSVIVMLGLLGILGWKVTVISSNFIALMLILHYGYEYSPKYKVSSTKKNYPNTPKNKITEIATNKMFLPILYTG